MSCQCIIKSGPNKGKNCPNIAKVGPRCRVHRSCAQTVVTLSWLENMTKLEGPVSITVLKPTTDLLVQLDRMAPYIILLGDIHVGAGKCSPPPCTAEDGCYSMYTEAESNFIQYLDRFVGANNIAADLFLEYWHPPGYGIDPEIDPGNDFASALMDTINAYANCRPDAKVKCPLSHMRVHMVDIRNIAAYESDADKYMGDSLYNIFIDHLSSPAFLKGRLSVIYPKFPFEYIMNLIRIYFDATITPEDIARIYWTDPFFVKYSRLHHELAQLPGKVASSIRAEHFDSVIDPTVNSARIDVARALKKSKYFTAEPLNKPSLLKSITSVCKQHQLEFFPLDSSKMVNVYTLARLLKVPKPLPGRDNRPSELAIVYLGDNHIDKIMGDLVRLDYYEVLRRKVADDREITDILDSLGAGADIDRQAAELLNKCLILG